MTSTKKALKAGSALLCALLLFCLFATVAPVAFASSPPSSSPTPAPSGGSLTVQSYQVIDTSGNAVQTIGPNKPFQLVLTLVDTRVNTIPANDKDLPVITLGSSAKFSAVTQDKIKFDKGIADADGWRFTVTFESISYLGGDNTLSFDVNYLGSVQQPLQTVSVPINNCRDAATVEKPSGDVTVLGYVVQNAAGSEIQMIEPNQKCQIVVKLADGRFNALPPADAGGQLINIKLTTTTAFTTPTMGDISYSSPRVVNGVLEYAVVFNDIMYQGGENKLSFDLSYPGTTTPMQSVTVGISQCRDPQSQPGAKPTLMVQDINYGGESIRAGDAFTLTLTSKNISKTQPLTDIITTITLPTGIVLASGSNATLSTGVTAGGTYSVTYMLHAQASAETGPANITVGYSFYPKGSSEQSTSSQTITVPVVQPDRFSFTAMDAPAELYAGEENSITINFVNKGKGLLYNFSAEIAGNITTPGQSQYLGNIASGATGSVDFMVQGDTPGTISGVVTITYEDINGNEKKQTHDYSLKVSAAPDMGDGGMFPVGPEEPLPAEGMPWWAWALIFGGGIVVLVVVIKAIKKARAKKLAKLLEDEDSGDEDF